MLMRQQTEEHKQFSSLPMQVVSINNSTWKVITPRQKIWCARSSLSSTHSPVASSQLKPKVIDKGEEAAAIGIKQEGRDNMEGKMEIIKIGDEVSDWIREEHRRYREREKLDWQKFGAMEIFLWSTKRPFQPQFYPSLNMVTLFIFNILLNFTIFNKKNRLNKKKKKSYEN